MTRTLPILLCLALLSACGGSDDPLGTDEDGAGPGPAGAWELASTEPAIELPADTRVTLDVEQLAGTRVRAGGGTPCNSYGGEVDAADGGWVTDGYAVTEMGCEPDRSAAQEAYLSALQAVDAWTRSGDTLTLTGPGVTLTFALVPEVEPAAFTDTVWELDSFLQGTGDDGAVSSTIGDAPTVTVVFAADGTFTLDTGCALFAGEWSTAGDEVLLPSWGRVEDDREPCDAATAELASSQESMLLDVLESAGFTAEVEGRRLTLRREAVGLGFRATT